MVVKNTIDIVIV